MWRFVFLLQLQKGGGPRDVLNEISLKIIHKLKVKITFYLKDTTAIKSIL